MDEKTDDINLKTFNSLSRNTPVALVVGAAGFLGSNLADKLLDKNIQVIGVDNLSTGQRTNLKDASKNGKFLFLETTAQDLNLGDLQRVDYVFIAVSGNFNLKSFLERIKRYGPKIVLVSTIELYDRGYTSKLGWLKDFESELAKFARDNKLNARVIRLSAIFGPRMHFRPYDPLIRLIKASLLGEIQKETIISEFSSRAVFIEDAINLIIKSVFSGSTALKIYDGSSFYPIKIEEIRQILLDPIWYEERGFKESELPPWPTPNLVKTQKELSWYPQKKIVEALKQTIAYFRDSEIGKDQIEGPFEDIKEGIVDEKKKVEIEEWAGDLKREEKVKVNIRKFELKTQHLLAILGVVIIFFGILQPLFTLTLGVLTLRSSLHQGAEQLKNGDFDKSLKFLASSKKGLNSLENLILSLGILKKAGIFSAHLTSLENLTNSLSFVISGGEHSILAASLLNRSFKIASGETNESQIELLEKTQLEVSSAIFEFSRAKATLSEVSFPGQIRDFSKRVDLYLEALQKIRTFSIILPNILSKDKKTYFILLVDNNTVRPSGGLVRALATAQFEKGGLQKIDIKAISALQAESLTQASPKEIEKYLGQTTWQLKNSLWESDFPTSARQIEKLIKREEKIDGIITLNFNAIAEMLPVIGSLKLEGKEIDSQNLWASVNGEGIDPNLISQEILKAFLHKIFFLPFKNWPELAAGLNKAITEKQILVFFTDRGLFTLAKAENMAGAIPKPLEPKTGEFRDFIMIAEASLKEDGSSFYTDRTFNLLTNIDEKGEVKQTLRISYSSQGSYSNYLRIYLPIESKILKALWGEADVSLSNETFTDYGRSGFGFLLPLPANAKKTFVLQYQLPKPLEFSGGRVMYGLSVIKQPGSKNEPFEWSFEPPGPQTVKSELSHDLSMQANLNI